MVKQNVICLSLVKEPLRTASRSICAVRDILPQTITDPPLNEVIGRSLGRQITYRSMRAI